MPVDRSQLFLRHLKSWTYLIQVHLEADKMGLTLADVFEPKSFKAKFARLEGGELMLVTASDGRMWASVTAITEDGYLVLEPMATSIPSPGSKKQAA